MIYSIGSARHAHATCLMWTGTKHHNSIHKVRKTDAKWRVCCMYQSFPCSQVVKETISKLVSGALSQCEPTAVVCESIQDVLSKLLLVCLNTPISQTRKWIHLRFNLDTSWLHVHHGSNSTTLFPLKKIRIAFFLFLLAVAELSELKHLVVTNRNG